MLYCQSFAHVYVQVSCWKTFSVVALSMIWVNYRLDDEQLNLFSIFEEVFLELINMFLISPMKWYWLDLDNLWHVTSLNTI